MNLMNSDKGVYEPLHIFPLLDKKCQLPPWRAIQLLMFCLHYGPKKTMSDYMSEDREKKRKEIELFKTILDDEAPLIAGQLHSGSGIVVPRSYEG